MYLDTYFLKGMEARDALDVVLVDAFSTILDMGILIWVHINTPKAPFTGSWKHVETWALHKLFQCATISCLLIRILQYSISAVMVVQQRALGISYPCPQIKYRSCTVTNYITGTCTSYDDDCIMKLTS